MGPSAPVAPSASTRRRISAPLETPAQSARGNAALAERVRRLRHGGQAARFEHELAGVNSRLDEVQAAILRSRLPALRDATGRRRALAARYRTALAATSVAVPPERDPGARLSPLSGAIG